MLSGIVAGLAPALRSALPNLIESLKEGGVASASHGKRRIRGILVGSEIALASVLLLGAGLMVRGFRSNLSSGAGLDPDTLLTLRLSLNNGTSYREVLSRIGAIPGVQSAAVVTALPHSRHGNVRTFEIEGKPAKGTERPHAMIQAVSANYFETLHLPLRAGRLLTTSDGPQQPPVALISESVSESLSGNAPIGRRIHLGAAWFTIVGIVGDIETPQPTVYLSYLQWPEREMDIAIRTTVPPMSLARAVRSAVGRRQPITNLNTMRELIRQESFGLVYIAALMGVFGALALALSFVGVYGLVSYLVSERTREVGVRMALGASPRVVVMMFCRDGFRTAAIGLAIGLLLTFGLARIMQSTITGIDAASFALWSMPLALAAAVALAIYLPARKATRVDPTLALREE